MPTRNFVYATFEDLTTRIVPNLEKARAGGAIEFISAAELSTKRNAPSLDELRILYYQARYEVYAYGQGLYGKKCNPAAAALEPCNPWLEKGMKVHSRSSVGVFGYPLPAPLVPPTP